jgi:hypothetical protein
VADFWWPFGRPVGVCPGVLFCIPSVESYFHTAIHKNHGFACYQESYGIAFEGDLGHPGEENMGKTTLTAAVLSVLLTFLALPALAAGIDGTWTATVETPRGTQDLTFVFKAEAGKLTGTVTGRRGESAIEDGTIEGGKISFKQTANFQGNTATIKYMGTVAGDEIKMTRAIEGFGEPREFTAKRK